MCPQSGVWLWRHIRAAFADARAISTNPSACVFQEATKSCEEAFDMFDADNNGVLDDDEMKHFIRFNFSKAFDDEVGESDIAEFKGVFDTNKDGVISKEEYVAFLNKPECNITEEKAMKMVAAVEAPRRCSRVLKSSSHVLLLFRHTSQAATVTVAMKVAMMTFLFGRRRNKQQKSPPSISPVKHDQH